MPTAPPKKRRINGWTLPLSPSIIILWILIALILVNYYGFKLVNLKIQNRLVLNLVSHHYFILSYICSSSYFVQIDISIYCFNAHTAGAGSIIERASVLQIYHSTIHIPLLVLKEIFLFRVKIVGVIHSTVIICIFAAMTIDSAEPVIRSRKRIQELSSFDSSQHLHVIENFYCNICDINVYAH